jgi:RNA polymerase sigma-70 factor, ECF subfamily
VIDAVHRGDVVAAASRLRQRHGVAVYRYCREALRDAALADDVHQQVFLHVLRDLPRFAGRSMVRVWLFRIARNRVLDAAKRRGRTERRLVALEHVELHDLTPSPIDAIDDARLREALVASIGELDEPVRTALLLRYQQGFTFEQMAVICGERAGTLNARVTRALPRLRAKIEARLHAPRRQSLRARAEQGAGQRARWTLFARTSEP